MKNLPLKRGEVGGGETEAYAARQGPTASATAPHLASPRWGEVEPGNIFAGNRLSAPLQK